MRWLWRIPILVIGTWLMYLWALADHDEVTGAHVIIPTIWIGATLGLWAAKAHDERALADAERHDILESAQRDMIQALYTEREVPSGGDVYTYAERDAFGYDDTDELIDRLDTELGNSQPAYADGGIIAPNEKRLEAEHVVVRFGF